MVLIGDRTIACHRVFLQYILLLFWTRLKNVYFFLPVKVLKDPKLKLPFKQPIYTLGMNIMAFLNEAKYGIILPCHLEK